MKVYFELTEKYNQCLNKCKMIPENVKCKSECELVYDDYPQILQKRYQGDNKELIDSKVSGLPSFDVYRRKDRGFFHSVFGKNFSEFFGPDKRQAQQK